MVDHYGYDHSTQELFLSVGRIGQVMKGLFDFVRATDAKQ